MKLKIKIFNKTNKSVFTKKKEGLSFVGRHVLKKEIQTQENTF